MRNNETKQMDNEILVKEKYIYITPRLIVHGNIEEITQGDEGGEQDGEGMGGTSIGGGA